MTDSPREPRPSPPGFMAAAWERFRQHKVAQWTIGYLVAAFSVLEGADVLGNSLGWPQAALRFLTLALILLVPVVVTLAWYHGARGQRRVSATEVGIVVFLLAGAGILLWRDSRVDREAVRPMAAPAGDSPGVVAPPPEKSIAVLPFSDMSPGRDQAYLSDGIAEEILNLLAQAADLRVIARTSSFAFKDQSLEIADIARRLNVAHVVEGSVRTSGDKLRVSAQLIRAASSTLLWSQQYDRPLDDILAVQDEIANDIVQALQVRIRGSTLSRPEGGTDDIEAYRLYLQAVNAFNVSTKPMLDEAERLLKRAIELDPGYGRAWSRLGWVAYSKSITSDKSAIEAYEEARQHAKRALELSPRLADAHALLQVIFVQADKDWARAESAGRQALALDPTNSEVLFSAGWFASAQGRYDEGERMYRRALERDPLNFNLVDGIAENYYRTGRLAEAENILRAHIDREPGSVWSRAMLSRVLLVQGKPGAALAMLEQEIDEGARLAYLPIMLEAAGRHAASDAAMRDQIAHWAATCAICIARAHAYRGENDLALEWLERAFRLKDSSLMNVIDEPLLGSLADDPRYHAFVREKLRVPARAASR